MRENMPDHPLSASRLENVESIRASASCLAANQRASRFLSGKFDFAIYLRHATSTTSFSAQHEYGPNKADSA